MRDNFKSCELKSSKVIWNYLSHINSRQLLLPGLSQTWRRHLWSFLYSHRHAGDDADRQQISLHPQEGKFCRPKSFRGLSHCLSTPLFILSIPVKQSSNFWGYSVEQMLMDLKMVSKRTVGGSAVISILDYSVCFKDVWSKKTNSHTWNEKLCVSMECGTRLICLTKAPIEFFHFHWGGISGPKVWLLPTFAYIVATNVLTWCGHFVGTLKSW